MKNKQTFNNLFYFYISWRKIYYFFKLKYLLIHKFTLYIIIEYLFKKVKLNFFEFQMPLSLHLQF
jgi:hypothetical protein